MRCDAKPVGRYPKPDLTCMNHKAKAQRQFFETHSTSPVPVCKKPDSAFDRADQLLLAHSASEQAAHQTAMRVTC